MNAIFYGDEASDEYRVGVLQITAELDLLTAQGRRSNSYTVKPLIEDTSSSARPGASLRAQRSSKKGIFAANAYVRVLGASVAVSAAEVAFCCPTTQADEDDRFHITRMRQAAALKQRDKHIDSLEEQAEIEAELEEEEEGPARY